MAFVMAAREFGDIGRPGVARRLAGKLGIRRSELRDWTLIAAIGALGAAVLIGSRFGGLI